MLARPLGYSFVLIPAALAVAMPADAAPEPGGLVNEDIPWVRYSDDDLRGSPTDRALEGVDEADLPEGFWQDDMYFGPQSGAASMYERMGMPTPRGVQHDETPGVVFLNFDGVTITGECTNSARNCTPLANEAGGTITFPSWGSDGDRASVFNGFQNDYAEMDLVVTTNRPPEYLPYVMNVIGGTNANAGMESGICGVAYVACDGAKRNHVSFTFPQSCGQVADVVSHETAHNWGLEHVTDNSDMMYPSVGSNRAFRDRCMTITTQDDNPIQCDYIHEAYCAAGGGQEQNSYTELHAVFGQKTPDTVAPEIVEITPADGSDFSSDEAWTISASVVENSNFVGARWTWDEGVPDGVGDDGVFTRCTNDVCNDDFGVFLDPTETAWDLLTLGPGAPQGNYSFKFEVMDAYGNSDVASITVTVEGGSSSGGSSSGGDDGSGDDGDGSSGGSSSGDDGGDGDGTGSSSGASSGMYPDDRSDDDKGCGCTTSPTTWGTGLLFFALLGLRRRRL
jgi:MYXO-CTERM domain-containing protein